LKKNVSKDWTNQAIRLFLKMTDTPTMTKRNFFKFPCKLALVKVDVALELMNKKTNLSSH
jgi:hypothetical protein